MSPPWEDYFCWPDRFSQDFTNTCSSFGCRPTLLHQPRRQFLSQFPVLRLYCALKAFLQPRLHNFLMAVAESHLRRKTHQDSMIGPIARGEELGVALRNVVRGQY